MKRYRFPGITPFSEGDQNIYWGRKDDILKVFNSITLNQSTVLVGRSGVGKTSLIYAGVLPMIHAETKGKANDNRCFDDIQIRIGIHTKGEELSLNQKIKKLIDGKQVTETFLDFLPIELKNSLWYEFKRLQFKNRKSKDAHIFLLIFDQLEELFTYPYDQFRGLLKDLKDLISTNLPDDIRQCIEKMEKQNPDLLTDEEMAILYKTIPIRFLFAVRSDKMSLVIRLRASIENILQNPIELRPLSTEQAYEAIKKPALETNGDFINGPFEIEDEAVRLICDFLSNLPKSDLESSFEDLYIEPFTLQIICQHIERKLLPFDNDRKIAAAEIGDPNEIIKNYYQEVLEGLKLDDETMGRVRRVIEEKLIYEPDQRRLIIYEDFIIQEYHLSKVVLDQLVDHKLLRRLTAVGTSCSYELSHDWMVIPILNAKKERLRLHDPDMFNASLIQLEEELKRNPNEYTAYKKIGDYYYFLQDYATAILKYSAAIRIKTQLGVKGGDLDLYFSRGDCYYKQKEFVLSNQDLEVVLQIELNHLLANFYTGYNYQMTQQNELAEKYYHKVISIDPAYANAYFNLGLLYKTMSLPDESEQAYLKCIELNAKDHEAYYNLGLLYTSKGERDQAIQNLQESIRIQPAFTDASIELALIYGDLKDYDGSIAILKKAVEFNSQHSRLLKSLGYVYYLKKSYPEAINIFYQAASLDPNDHEPSYYLGVIANDLAKYNDAINYLQKSISLKPEHINSLLEKGYAHRMLQQVNEAISCYEAILKLDPKNENASRNLESVTKYSQSEKELIESLEPDPNNLNSLYTLGTLANNKGNYEQAISYFERLLKINPEHTNAMIEQAYAYFGLGKNEEAIECYKDIIKTDPKNIIALRALGKTYDSAGDSDKAEQYFSAVIELDKFDYDSYFRLGMIANNKAQFEKAVEYLDKAISLKQDYSGALVEKGFALSKLGKPQDAIDCYSRILTFDPSNAKAFYNRGILYSDLKEYEPAIDNQKKAIELDPGNPHPYFELGLISHRKKDYSMAIQYFEKCISIDPAYTQSYEYLAYYYLEAKQYDKAIKYYKKIIHLNPLNGNAYYNLGIANQSEGKYEEALINFQNAVKMDPADFEAAYSIAKIHEQLNNKGEAVKYYQQAVSINPTFTKASERLEQLLTLAH